MGPASKTGNDCRKGTIPYIRTAAVPRGSKKGREGEDDLAKDQFD